ncbi:SDR family oxidoreductase [Petrachloros mirabilis]
MTGGLGILGRYFCRALAEYRAHVVVADLDGTAAARFAAELSADTGVSCLGIACDVADETSVESLVRATVAEFGAVHVLHNNAATKSDDLAAFFAPAEEYPLDEWRKVMAVNLDGMFLVARAVGRQMIAQGGGGSIIQTSSIYGILGADRRIYEGSSYLGQQINTPPVYATSKAGVIGLTRYLATDWACHGIRVNALVLGGVQSGQNDIFIRKYTDRVPLGRMGHPEDMVGALLFLASDASGYITGQSIAVDGGLSAW